MTLKINPINFKSGISQNQQYLFVSKPQTGEGQRQSSTNGAKILAGMSLAGVVGLSIVTISQRKNLQKLQQIITESAEKAKNNIQIPEKEEVIPYVVKKFEETSLYGAFKESGKNFIDFISNVHAPKNVKEFLFGITSDEKVSGDFIREITQNPRESFKNTKILIDAAGGENNLLDWLHAPEGYNNAYQKYLTKMLNAPETKIEDLIEISPNWHLFVFLYKTGNQGVKNIRWGQLPEDFQALGDFGHFVNWIFSKQDYSQIYEYSGKYMKIQPLKEGLSGKFPLKLQFCTSDGKLLNKPYIIKKEFCPSSQNDHINQAYRSDSVFINAQLDYYLSRHKSPNIPEFHYYDCSVNAALYDFIEGENYTASSNIIEVNRAMKDLNKLGVFYNDCKGTGNILIDNGVMKIIDSGESYFHDVLRPPCSVLHFELPNWCGNRIENLTLNKLFGDC